MNEKEITYLRSTIFLDQYNKNQCISKYYIGRKLMANMKTKRVLKNGKRRDVASLTDVVKSLKRSAPENLTMAFTLPWDDVRQLMIFYILITCLVYKYI